LTRLLADENIPRKTVDMLKTSHDIKLKPDKTNIGTL